jgi:hypothetical protein
MSSLVSHQNKEFLWGILAEEGVFDGIPTNVNPEDIKCVFERILKNLSANIPGLYAAKLKELHNAKQRSIADEDYDAAKKIHATIGEMEAIFPRLEKLEARKHQAIQAEDFESAKQLKCEIERVRAASLILLEIGCFVRSLAPEGFGDSFPAEWFIIYNLGLKVLSKKVGQGFRAQSTLDFTGYVAVVFRNIFIG